MGNLTVKENGEMVNFISPNVSKITSFKVHFSPKQEGTGDPSPDNVREIVGWDGVEGYGCGKNLFDKTAYENIYTIYDYTDSSYRCKKIQLKPNTTYTVSFTSTGADANVIILFNYTSHVNGNTFLDLRKASGSKTYTTDDTGCLYIGSVNTNNDKYNARMSVCEIQIEEGLTATDYEPYTGQTYPITFPTEAGIVYGGYVDLISGELVVDKAMETFDGSETWNTATVSSKTAYQTRRPVDIASGAVFTSNIITRITSLSGTILDNVGYFGGTYLNVYAPSLSIEEWIAMLTTTPLQIVYKLAEPITHQLTPQQLSTLKGQNNFWSNADYVEIEYELTETFDIQKAKRKIILNQPHVESASDDIVTFDTDMKGKLKECKVYFSPVQEGEGDPSPDNVRNITGWNGVNIYKAGQNLIPENIPAQFYRVYPSGGHFIESGTAFSTFIIPVPRGKICLARTTRSLLPYGALCDELPTVGANAFNAVTMTNRNNYIFDNSEGHKYFAITVNRSVEVNSDWDSFLDTEPRLTISDIVQPYTAPTNISTYSIDWTDEAGTVFGGYVDLISGELVQTWYGFILDGVNNYLNSTPQLLNNGLATIYDYIGSGGLNNLPKGPVNTYTGAIICNKFPLAYSRENEGIATGSGSLYIRLILDPSKLEDVSSTSAIKESMIKWQQENPLQIVYKLAEPIHYSLTPQQILTFKGINNVYSDTNGQMEIKYWKH